MQEDRAHQVAIVGGGAAGYFAAITCAEANPQARVLLLERSKEVLEKVRISGGGRCNVTHACFDPKLLCANYPRGSKELLGPFHRFGPEDTVAWFESRGVPLKVEEDGRMFPRSDQSESIIRCLMGAAREAGVVLQTKMALRQLHPPSQPGQRWKLVFADAEPVYADKVMLATGSNRAVWNLVEQLGHRIVPPVPSLFTFNIKDARLQDLLGISVPSAQLEIPEFKLEAEGPLLITHWGLSGPAVLRLSAWGARPLASCQYHFLLKVNWVGEPISAWKEKARTVKQSEPRKTIHNLAPVSLPQRLWKRLCEAAGISDTMRWADLSNNQLQELAAQVCEASFQVKGKSTFKEEFVTAGGVDLSEIDFRRFESRIHPGLHFAGELLDIDAITGGFNFQAAWTGGYIAGLELAQP
jgi:predicted Rossmann fold flavoprotein